MGKGDCTKGGGNDFFFQLGGSASYVGRWFLAGVDVRMFAVSEAMWIVGGHPGLVF
jgi:hypothetical protein